MGSKDMRPHNSILEAERAHEGLIPVKFEGDSLEFLRATMMGKIWPTREQIYAAKSVLPVEYPPAATVDGRSVEEVRAEIVEEQGRENAGWREELTDEIRRHRAAIIEYRDEQLRAWMEAGELTQGAAELVRGLWANGADDRPFHIDDLAMPDGGRAGHVSLISEIARPPQPAVVVRKRPGPVVEGEAVRHDYETADEAIEKPGIFRAKSPAAADILGPTRGPISAYTKAPTGAENGQLGAPTSKATIQNEPQPDRRPLSVQHRHLIRPY
jgi:hypothetical protein